jgi:hypothetical protein
MSRIVIVELTTLPPSISRLSRQCGILNISQPYRPTLPFTGIALLLLYLYIFRGQEPMTNYKDNTNTENKNMKIRNRIIIIIIIVVYLRAQLNSQRPITKLAHYTKIYKEHGIRNAETCNKNDNNKTK